MVTVPTYPPVRQPSVWNAWLLSMEAFKDGFTSSGTFHTGSDFIIPFDGTDYYACNAYQIIYGGPDDAGAVDGGDFIAVVQAAADALATTGGTIEFASGTFTLDDSISTTETINWIGQGNTDDTGQAGTTLVRTTDDPIFLINGADQRHISFKNMRLKGAGKGVGSSGLILCAADSGELLLEKVTFAESGGVGLDLDSTSYWATLVNCQANYLTGALVSKVTPDTGTTVNLHNCIAHHGGALADLYGVKGVNIIGGGGDNWDGFAVKLQLCTGTVHGVDLEGVNGAGTSGHGIWLVSSAVDVAGCRIRDWGADTTYYPIYLSGGSACATVHANTIESTEADYTVAFAADAAGYDVYNNTLDKNAVGYTGKTKCHMRYNEGYQTVVSGTGEAGHGDYIDFPYTLAGTPNIVLITVNENDARYIAQAYELSTTRIRIYLWDDIAGASEAVDKTISYTAEYKP